MSATEKDLVYEQEVDFRGKECQGYVNRERRLYGARYDTFSNSGRVSRARLHRLFRLLECDSRPDNRARLVLPSLTLLVLHH